jgi:hypothetical protein
MSKQQWEDCYYLNSPEYQEYQRNMRIERGVETIQDYESIYYNCDYDYPEEEQ